MCQPICWWQLGVNGLKKYSKQGIWCGKEYSQWVVFPYESYTFPYESRQFNNTWFNMQYLRDFGPVSNNIDTLKCWINLSDRTLVYNRSIPLNEYQCQSRHFCNSWFNIQYLRDLGPENKNIDTLKCWIHLSDQYHCMNISVDSFAMYTWCNIQYLRDFGPVSKNIDTLKHWTNLSDIILI